MVTAHSMCLVIPNNILNSTRHMLFNHILLTNHNSDDATDYVEKQRYGRHCTVVVAVLPYEW